MARKKINDIQESLKLKLWELIFKVIDDKPNGFTSDDVWVASYRTSIPPATIRRFLGSFLKSCKDSGRIRKTGECKTSFRAGNSTLPIYAKSDAAK